MQRAPYMNSLRENEEDKLVTMGKGVIRVVLEEISTKHDYTLLMVRSIWNEIFKNSSQMKGFDDSVF